MALSTYEAEYTGQPQAAKDAVWLMSLLCQLAGNDKSILIYFIIIFPPLISFLLFTSYLDISHLLFFVTISLLIRGNKKVSNS